MQRHPPSPPTQCLAQAGYHGQQAATDHATTAQGLPAKADVDAGPVAVFGFTSIARAEVSAFLVSFTAQGIILFILLRCSTVVEGRVAIPLPGKE